MRICWENFILQTFSDSKGDIFWHSCSEVQGAILIFDVHAENGSGEAGMPLLTSMFAILMTLLDVLEKKKQLFNFLLLSYNTKLW